MEAVARCLGAAELGVVDGSISGPPPRAAGTTTVYLSGSRAAEVASLDAPGLEFRVVSETVGAASAIKMSTASFCKGQTGLFAHVAEMEEIAASQEQVGLSPDLFAAFTGLYRGMSESSLAEAAPEDVDPGLPLGPLLDRLG